MLDVASRAQDRARPSSNRAFLLLSTFEGANLSKVLDIELGGLRLRLTREEDLNVVQRDVCVGELVE